MVVFTQRVGSIKGYKRRSVFASCVNGAMERHVCLNGPFISGNVQCNANSDAHHMFRLRLDVSFCIDARKKFRVFAFRCHCRRDFFWSKHKSVCLKIPIRHKCYVWRVTHALFISENSLPLILVLRFVAGRTWWTWGRCAHRTRGRTSTWPSASPRTSSASPGCSTLKVSQCFLFLVSAERG